MALGSLVQHFSQYPLDSWPRTSLTDDITINAEPYIVILTEISPLRPLASTLLQRTPPAASLRGPAISFPQEPLHHRLMPEALTQLTLCQTLPLSRRRCLMPLPSPPRYQKSPLSRPRCQRLPFTQPRCRRAPLS